MFTIRPFEATEEEYKAFAALEAAVWPEYPDTVEEWKHRDSTREPQYLFQRFVVELDGKLVADGIYCEPWWSMRPNKYYINIAVHPNHRRKGIGTALYDHIMGFVNEKEPELVVSNTREDQKDGIRFLTKRGFVQVMRAPVSQLDVLKFDPEPFAGTLQRVDELGIEIQSVSELAGNDNEWKHKFWELDWELLQDVPSPEPFTRIPYENFVERVLSSPRFLPDGIFIALDKGQWIGMSGLWAAQGDPEKLFTGLTGVARNHRRKGIATTMKVRAIAFAKEYGAKYVDTDNEENNPMYLLNLKLGFVPRPAWLDYEKKIAK